MVVRLVRTKDASSKAVLTSPGSTSPSTTSPSAATPSSTSNCEETTEEYEVEIPGDDSDDEAEAPYCDEVESEADEVSADSNPLSRRGRGQHWQRSLDVEFAGLDKRYIPKAPAGVPGAQRRSRRHTAQEPRAFATSTGL